MQKETPPRLEVSFRLEKKEYMQAAMILARRTGSLRSLPLVLVAAALLLTVGLFSFRWFLTVPLLPWLICLSCPLLLLLFFAVEPAGVRKQAEKDFRTYQAVMEPTSMRLYQDNVVTRSDTMTLYDQYALLLECIETPTLFIFIKDRERCLILPKRSIPPEKEKETAEFLRLTFVRKRRVMRSWMF